MKCANKILIIILIALVFILSCSCSSPQKKKGSDSKFSNGKEQPSELQKLLADIENTYESIDKMITEEKKKEKEKEKSKPVQGPVGGSKSEGSSSGQQQGKEQGQEKSGKGKEDESKKPEDKSKEEWKKIEDDVEKLHHDWNGFEPKAEEENISRDKITSFEDQLNSLSSAIENKELKEALSSVNGLQKEVSEFTGKFKEVVPATLYDIKYQYQQTYIEALKDVWPKAKNQASETLKIWDDAKSDLEKEDKDLAMKMEFSLKDLEHSITTKDLNVLSIKVKVITQNYKAFEKIYKDKAKEKEDKNNKK